MRSPEEVANEIYERMKSMEAKTIDYGGIGWSVNHMRHGHKMRRKVWRDRSIWVGYIDGNDLAFAVPGAGTLPVRPMLLMRNSDGTVGPYSPGQADLLAADWEIYEASS
jgi:Protein of unknown function (DUF2829)